MIPDSLLNGDNAAFLDAEYERWLHDPEAVDADLRALFDGLDGHTNGSTQIGPSFAPRSIFAGSMVVAGADERAVERRAATVQMINAYRVRGHFKANIDPLGRREKVEHPELTPGYYGLSEADLQEEVSTRPLFGMPPRAKLAEVLARCRVAPCWCCSSRPPASRAP